MFHKLLGLSAAVALSFAAPADARVTRIVIDQTVSPAFCKAVEGAPAACASYGAIGQYEQIAGRAWGELDPADPLNALIQDIALAKDRDGKVRYVATFVITKPIDMAKAGGLLWHDVPNRGRQVLIAPAERALGDIGLASAWQAGSGAQPLIVQTNPLPYLPATLDTAQARLVSREHETMEGVVRGERAIAPADWKFCGGGTFEEPVPLTQLPVQICLKGGFDPARLYQVVQRFLLPKDADALVAAAEASKVLK